MSISISMSSSSSLSSSHSPTSHHSQSPSAPSSSSSSLLLSSSSTPSLLSSPTSLSSAPSTSLHQTSFSPSSPSPPPPSSLSIFLVVLCYFIVSILLVFVNKILLTPSNVSTLPAPIFLTWMQCVMTCGILHALSAISRYVSSPSRFLPFPLPLPPSLLLSLSDFPPMTFSFQVAKAIFPLSVIFVLMIYFNTLCLKYVEVSFYNVARSLTIVVNVVFSFFLLGEKTSKPTLFCLLIVIFGFFIGSEGEVRFSLIGTMFGVSSSVFVSLNAIYTKKLIVLVDGDKWKLQYYNNVNASILFVFFILFSGEHHIILAYKELFWTLPFWTLNVVAGILGFLIGIVTVMQISYTSPLTHNISGTAKSCVQTILAIWIWRNPINTKGIMGIILVIGGSAIYTYIRHGENEKDKEKEGNGTVTGKQQQHPIHHKNNALYSPLPPNESVHHNHHIHHHDHGHVHENDDVESAHEFVSHETTLVSIPMGEIRKS